MSRSQEMPPEREDVAKSALAQFILENTGQNALEAIDEIVLSYVFSISETLAHLDSPEDAFDVDQFSEMMAAYIPTFGTINSDAICKWMFDLASRLSQLQSRYSSGPSSPVIPSPGGGSVTLPDEQIADKIGSIMDSPKMVSGTPSLQLSPQHRDADMLPHARNASWLENGVSNHVVTQMTAEEVSAQLKVLTELFPNACTMEVQHCLSIAQGDCEKAAQLLLQQQESGDRICQPQILMHAGKPGTRHPTESIRQDREMRDNLLARYAYIDKEEDIKEHKPVAPKSEPKKLIRYRDNKVVSMKGERYSEVKLEEPEHMKKTHITLKPARQYRFH